MIERPVAGTYLSLDQFDELVSLMFPIMIFAEGGYFGDLIRTTERLLGDPMENDYFSMYKVRIANPDARWVYSRGCRVATMADALLVKLACDFEVMITETDHD